MHNPKDEEFAVSLNQWELYYEMFNYFNRELFEGDLPDCVLNFSRESLRVGAFFAPERWKGEDGVKHEISLNPVLMALVSAERECSFLVHEQAHLWQREYGKPGRRGYHNREFAMKMESIGLMASRTGKPGGKKTGEKMSHYVIPGGLFEKAFKNMGKDSYFPYLCTEGEWYKIPDPGFIVKPDETEDEMGEGVGDDKAKKDDGIMDLGEGVFVKKERNKSNRLKYSCPKCRRYNFWAKPGARAMCLDCYEESGEVHEFKEIV